MCMGCVRVSCRKPQYNMASDKPLALVDCQFEHLSFHIQPDTLMRLRQSLFGHWDSYAIAGAMSRCGLGTALEGGAEAGAEAAMSLRQALREGLRNHRPLSERALEGNARVHGVCCRFDFLLSGLWLQTRTMCDARAKTSGRRRRRPGRTVLWRESVGSVKRCIALR